MISRVNPHFNLMNSNKYIELKEGYNERRKNVLLFVRSWYHNHIIEITIRKHTNDNFDIKISLPLTSNNYPITKKINTSSKCSIG